MLITLIILGAFWFYPIIALQVVKRTRTNLPRRNKILRISLIITACTLLGVFTNVSTTLAVLDWLLLTSCYFTISLLLWLTTTIHKSALKWPAIILAGIIFGACYLGSTFGMMGVGMYSTEIQTSHEKWLSNGLIYKEQTRGNVLTSYRFKRVEIYRTIPWLPLIEWRIESKEYNSIAAYIKPLVTVYNPGEKKLYLSGSGKWGYQFVHFEDTILIR